MGLWARITSLGSGLVGLVTGASGIAGAVTETAKAAEAAAAAVHDHNGNVAGQDHVTAVNNGEKADVNAKVADAAVKSSPDRNLKQLRGGSA